MKVGLADVCWKNCTEPILFVESCMIEIIHMSTRSLNDTQPKRESSVFQDRR